MLGDASTSSWKDKKILVSLKGSYSSIEVMHYFSQITSIVHGNILAVMYLNVDFGQFFPRSAEELCDILKPVSSSNKQ